MASSVMHMCVAKEINKILNIKDKDTYLLGSVAADTNSKVGKDKNISHFINKKGNIDLNMFLNKYRKRLNEPFIMGWFIHIYTDLLWTDYFTKRFVKDNYICLINGDKVPFTEENHVRYIYRDYSNADIILMEKYNINFEVLYDKSKRLPNNIDEIPLDKIYVLFNYVEMMITGYDEKDIYIFDINVVEDFIEEASNIIINYIRNNHLISK